MRGRFSVEAVFAVVDRLTGPVRRMQGRIERMLRGTGSAVRAVGRAISRMRLAIGAAAAAAGLSLAAIGAAIRDVVQVGADFEQTMVRAAAKFPGGIRRGTEEFHRLQDTAARVGAETEFTASQAAAGLEFLAMAGFNADQAIASLPGVVDLATASGMDLAQATDIASDSLGAFGLMTQDTAQLGENLARVNDVIARTTNSANTNVEQMFEAIRMGGPAATAAGQSMETFSAMVGELAGAGVKGSEAGTALRNMMIRLQAPAAAGRRALRRLGVQVLDGEGNMRDMFDIMQDLQRGLAGRGTGQQAQFLDAIFGARGITAANVLLQSGSERLRAFRENLVDAGGAAGNMASQMRDTTQGDLDSFGSAIEAVKIAIFEVVRGPLREIVQATTAWFRANREVIASGIQTAVTWLIDNMPTIVTWARRIAITVGAVAAVFALAFAGIAAAGAAAWAALAFVIDGLVQLWDWLSTTVPPIAQAVADAFLGAWQSVRDFFAGTWEFIVGLAVLSGRAVAPIVRPIMDALGSAASWLRDRWAPIGEFFASLWSGIRSGAGSAWSTIVSAATTIASRVRAIWQPIGAFFSNLWTSIAATFRATLGAVLETITNAVGYVRGVGREHLGTESDEAPPAPQVVTPEGAISRSITESTTTERAEVTIRDETGRAEMPRQRRNAPVRLQPSGAF